MNVNYGVKKFMNKKQFDAWHTLYCESVSVFSLHGFPPFGCLQINQTL